MRASFVCARYMKDCSGARKQKYIKFSFLVIYISNIICEIHGCVQTQLVFHKRDFNIAFSRLKNAERQ